MSLIGTVKGKDAIIFDDMIDSGGTICKAAA
jgi:phosphoribosylpyrophosphate synthetase